MYVFTGWDDNDPSVEMDIRGEEYKRLIETCYCRCRYFTLNENRPDTVFDLPEKELEITTLQDRRPIGYRHLYFFSEKAKQYLMNKVDSLFSWITWGTEYQGQKGGLLPEDLCFYRSDGSVFLWSETHEGICALCPRPGEDVSAIISSGGWHENTGNVWDLPKNLEDYNVLF